MAFHLAQSIWGRLLAPFKAYPALRFSGLIWLFTLSGMALVLAHTPPQATGLFWPAEYLAAGSVTIGHLMILPPLLLNQEHRPMHTLKRWLGGLTLNLGGSLALMSSLLLILK